MQSEVKRATLFICFDFVLLIVCQSEEVARILMQGFGIDNTFHDK